MPLVLVDTAGCGAEEGREEEGASWYNEGEVECVVGVVRELLEGGVRGGGVGVITPYSAQKSRYAMPQSIILLKLKDKIQAEACKQQLKHSLINSTSIRMIQRHDSTHRSTL